MVSTPSAIEAERTDRLVAGYAALAIGIHVLEAALPSPVPGIKPGLANVVTLIVLARHGLRVAAGVVILRVLAGSLILGTTLGPAFWLSSAGAAGSLAALALGRSWNRMLPAMPLSLHGLAVLAALAHLTSQFLLAYIWLVPHPALLTLLPVLLAAALIFGLLTGALAQAILERMRRQEAGQIRPE